jgi:hypothetical protein
MSNIQGGEDIVYGRKGKGSTVHLLTEGNGLPLAFLVTAANVAEVTVGLTVLDRVRVPRPQGDAPSSDRPAWGPTKVMTVRNSGRDCDGGGFSLRYPCGYGPTAGVGLAALQRPTRSASLAGRWSGATAGWTTGVGWSLDMTGTPKAMWPF